MNIVCLDLEGVLVPEIWIAFSQASGIPELKRTTRDEPDYDKLMKWRLGILREHGLGLKDIQDTIATIDPMPGAREFLDTLRSETQAIILSDTFTQFASPLMKKLGWPTIFCNELEVGADGMITDYRIRVKKSKLSTVKVLLLIWTSLNYRPAHLVAYTVSLLGYLNRYLKWVEFNPPKPVPSIVFYPLSQWQTWRRHTGKACELHVNPPCSLLKGCTELISWGLLIQAPSIVYLVQQLSKF